MKVEFHRKTFVILGKLDAMGKHEAWNKIQELGGYVSSTPRPSSDYIVIGDRPGKKLALVEKVGKPTLTEEEFLAAIHATETGREEGQESVDFDDALVGLRELLYEAPSRELWGQIRELLDQCEPAQLEATVDYTEQHISQWPGGDEHPDAPLPMAFHEVPAELRRFSVAWRNMALAGERSPLLRLGRHLDLSQAGLEGDQAMRLTDHPDLVNLQSLDLGTGNRFDTSFFEALRHTEQLPQLTSLTLHQLTTETATALCGAHNMTGLRHVTVAGLAEYGYVGDSAKVYDKLFLADWWEQIEGLACCSAGMYGHRSFHRTFYPQLAKQAHRMRKLRHLVLEDSNRIEALLETDLCLRVQRLSMGLCDAESSEMMVEHLAANRDQLAVEALDVSRGTFMGAHRRPKKHAKPPQKAAIERLIQETDWGSLRRVMVDDSLLGVRLKKKLDAWSEEAGVEVVSSPWTA